MAGKIGGVATIAALGVTTLTVGMAYIDHLFSEAQKEQRAAVEKDVASSNADAMVRGLVEKGDIQGAIAKQREALKLKEEAITQTKGTGPGTGGKILEGALTLGGLIDIDAFKARDKSIESAVKQQSKEAADMRRLLGRLVELAESQPTPGGGPPVGGRGAQ